MAVGNDDTLGGYFAEHKRPPAFEGSDGASYSVEMYCDDDPISPGRYGAAILFVRWSAKGEEPIGHLETEYLAFGSSSAEARAALEDITLHDVKHRLDELIQNKKDINW